MPTKLQVLTENGKQWVTYDGKRLPLYMVNNRNYFLDAIPIDEIERDEEAQPREYTESAARKIAESVSEKVLMQPILTRYDPERELFLVIEGQHRWRAIKDILQYENIPAIVYLELDKHLALLCGLEANAEDRARALSGGDLSRKTHAIMNEYADLLAKENPNDPVTETAILKRLGKNTKAQQRKYLLGKLAEDVRQIDGSRIAPYISDRQSRTKPVTARNFMAFLNSLARTSPIDEEWGSEDNLRRDELQNVLIITNLLAEELFEDGKWAPEDSETIDHEHAVNICRHHPFQALGYAIAKVIDQQNGGDATIGACYAPTKDIDWEKVEKDVKEILRNPVWDQPHVYNLRSQEELREELSKAGII